MKHDVRRLTGADSGPFRTLHLEALRRYPEAFSAAYEDEGVVAEGVFEERLDHGTVFGGFAEARLEAIVTYHRQALRKRRHVAMVSGMYVREAYQGSGLAAALFDAVIDHAKQEVDQLELYVAVENARARRFYAGFGFEPYGVMRRALRVDGIDCDAAMLVLIFQ